MQISLTVRGKAQIGEENLIPGCDFQHTEASYLHTVCCPSM